MGTLSAQGFSIHFLHEYLILATLLPAQQPAALTRQRHTPHLLYRPWDGGGGRCRTAEDVGNISKVNLWAPMASLLLLMHSV